MRMSPIGSGMRFSVVGTRADSQPPGLGVSILWEDGSGREPTTSLTVTTHPEIVGFSLCVNSTHQNMVCSGSLLELRHWVEYTG